MARINNRATMRQVDIHLLSIRIRFRARYIRRSAKQHSRALYPRSCIIVLINFIIIFEMYVHKKLIYFVKRKAERKRERECERETAGRLGNSRTDCIRACVRAYARACVSRIHLYVCIRDIACANASGETNCCNCIFYQRRE